MKQSFRKFVSTSVSLALTLSFAGLGGVAHAAGQLTSSTATLTEVRENLNSSHTLATRVASAVSIKKVTFEYRTTASSGSTVPQDFANSSASNGGVTVAGNADGAWTLDASTRGTLTYTRSTATAALTVNDTLSFKVDGIHNNRTTGTDLCDTITNSETCWIRIKTYGSDGTTLVDTSTTTYTIIDSIEVKATIDPILTFTVAGVAVSTSPDAGAGTTSVDTFPTSIPFGNVTLGSAKTASQQLTVLTNANSGYNVYNKFIGTGPGGTDLMVGTYTANNIDPFIGGGAGWSEDNGGTTPPKSWAVPTGTTGSSDTAWLGIRTNNTGISGFSSGTWAPPYVGSNIGKKVMAKGGPDDGSVPTYVSFKIQANAYQPSDTYTGNTVYNVVAVY